ncbi:MAG: hypothetical protein M1154_07080 [Gammaproteobacteria bacterium]|nr:hypothetical protein [Gammaproteobacteria bacterium]
MTETWIPDAGLLGMGVDITQAKNITTVLKQEWCARKCHPTFFDILCVGDLKHGARQPKNCRFESLSPLLKHSDDALYQAKRSGRDRISGPQDGSQVEAS